MAINPATKRQKLLSHVSPKVADYIFYEVRDSRISAHEAPPEYGAAHPDKFRYPGHELVLIAPHDEAGMQRWYYAKVRAMQNDYNWEIHQLPGAERGYDSAFRLWLVKRIDWVNNGGPGTDLGGVDEDTYGGGMGLALIPGGFSDDYDNTAFSVDSAPAIAAEFDASFNSDYKVEGAAAPNPLIGYTRISQEVVRVDEQLDSVYVLVRQHFIKLDTYEDTELDLETGEVRPVTRELSLSPTPSGGPTGVIQSDGSYKETTQLNHRLYLHTTRKAAVLGELGAGGSTRTYQTTETYYWPAVLLNLRLSEKLRNHDGEWIRSIVDVDVHPPYNGPCPALVVESWHLAPQVIAAPVTPIMAPRAIDYNGAFMSFQVYPCLHPLIEVTEGILGSGHPTYQAFSRYVDFPATTDENGAELTTWPPSVTLTDQRPYRGGYLKREVTIYRPFAPTSPGAIVIS